MHVSSRENISSITRFPCIAATYVLRADDRGREGEVEAVCRPAVASVASLAVFIT